jgi:hypothetical protein
MAGGNLPNVLVNAANDAAAAAAGVNVGQRIATDRSDGEGRLMGIFDIFSDQPARDAAAAQAMAAGLNRLAGYFGSMRCTEFRGAAAGGIANAATGLGTGLANISGNLGGSLAGLNTGLGTGQAALDTGLGTSIANTSTGLGGALNANATNLGTGLANTSMGLGAGLNANATNLGGSLANTYTGLGGATAGQQDILAQLGYSTQTGIGNANANADLARYTASGNFWNMLGGIGGMKTSGGGTLGGNAVQGLGNAASSATSGVGDAATAAAGGIGDALSSLMMFSDERLKQDIEPVGELNDGQPVYRYRYIGDNIFRIGLMAQDVEKTHPEAVAEIGGFKAVDYGKATEYAADLSRFLEAA